MSITVKTRKAIWAKSGNQCAICKRLLFDDSKDVLNIGEECHIISGKPNGPRHISGIDNYNTADNILLLCCNDHKEVDTLVDKYPVECLKKIKAEHEQWVKEQLISDNNNHLLPRITSGAELFSILSEATCMEKEYGEDCKTREEAQYIDLVFGNLLDWLDLLDDGTEAEQRSLSLNEILLDLQEHDLWIFGKLERKSVVIMGDRAEEPVAVLKIVKQNNAEIVKKVVNT